jgi:OOP family OmpA-OmpF porin
MKLNFKNASLFVTGMLMGGTVFAQTTDTTHVSSDYVKPFSGDNAFRTWSIGVSGGVLTPYTIFGSNRKQDFTSPNAEIGYGGYIKKQILPSFGIQADFFAGKLSADHSNPASTDQAFNSFSTKIQYAASLSANYTLANINWHYKKTAIQPYFTLGVGTMGYKPVLTYADGTVSNFKTDNNGNISELYLPVGAGLKFDISKGVNIDLGYQVNFVYSDNVDGFNYGSTNDRFSYAHIGLEFALGGRSKPQLATHNPVNSMRQEYLWENEQTKNQLEGQIAAENAKNEQLRNDLNTTNANLAKLTTDSDGDGVPDFFDKCPNTPAGTKVDGSGCPLPIVKPETKVYITEQDRRVVNEAVRNLEFDFGKATIREHSFASLDQLAELLKTKGFNLKLAGYTDSRGSAAYNLKLSEDRAEAIKTYLVAKGVDETKIQAQGHGKANPIATNKTDAGRQQNRRVEFSIY